MTGIGPNAFATPDVTGVVLPNTLISIASDAFQGSAISEIHIPADVSDISSNVFSDCISLASITVDPANTVYDSRNDCNAIIDGYNTLIAGCQNTVIPASVTKIGVNAFHGCSGLTHMVIPNTVTKIDYAAFSGCTGLADVEIPNSVTTIYINAFYGCSALTDVVLPDSITYLGRHAFENCRQLTTVKLPDNITSIQNGLFSGCWALSNIEIPVTVTEIAGSAFYDCHGLTNVVVPDNVISIGYMAFGKCTQLKTVTIGKSLRQFTSGYPFAGCTALESITMSPVTPPSLNNAFYAYENNLYEQVTLFVPQESLNDYRAHSTWGKFTHIVPFIGAGPGDIDGNGSIDISDVTGLIDMLLAGEGLPAYCDVDGDGEVDINDITLLIDRLLNAG